MVSARRLRSKPERFRMYCSVLRDSAAMSIQATSGVQATSELISVNDHAATLVASTESWEVICALPPSESLLAEHERRQRLLDAAHAEARTGFAAELLLAADQFVIRPTGRVRDAGRAHASGDQVRTVLARYHCFTDWGRATMI